VTRAGVSLRTKEAIVTFEPEQVGVSQMIDAVTRLGFRASLKQPTRLPPYTEPP
jgi:hypothetical protein